MFRKISILLSLLLLLLNTTVEAQCTYSTAVSDVTLQCYGGGLARSSVAYNPNQDRYYSINAGSAGYPLEVYTTTGGNPTYTINAGADYRGYWWNPFTGKPEGNTYNSGGLYTNLLDASFNPTNTANSVTAANMPDPQCTGVCDVYNDVVYYHYNSVIYRYSRLTGVFTSSTAISGLPLTSLFRNLYSLGYTGIPGSELVIYDYVLKQIYFINASTGAYVSTCQLPSSTAPAPSQYGIGFANNRVFLYDQTSSTWIGYPITNSACSGEMLSFNGAQYLSRPAVSLATNWSAELWIKPSAVSGGWYVPFGQAFWNNLQGFVFRINSSNVGVEAPGGMLIEAPVTANAWTHLAFTYDNGICTFYKDGLIVGTASKTIAAATTSMLIGARMNNASSGVGDFFYGSIDEVRVWNTTRTGCEIQTNMKAQITGTASGLIANYHFNQGVASGSNTSITRLWDASGSVNTVTLSNFALTGSTTNWVSPGAIAIGYTTQTVPASEINITGNGVSIVDGDITPSTSDFTDFGNNLTRTFVIQNTTSGTLSIGSPILTGTAAAFFSITTAPAATLAASATTSFVITSTNTPGTYTAQVNIVNNDCSEPVYNFVITSTVNTGAAVSLDGSDDYVFVANTASLNAFPLTIETWVKTAFTSTPLGAGIVTKYVSNSYNGWNLYTTGGYVYGFYFKDASNYIAYPLTSTVTISDNQWHHVAMVVDATGGVIYIDGKQASPKAPWVGTPGAPTTNIYVTMGAYDLAFPGSIDEVRLWNTARSQCQIQQYMNAEIPTTSTGLMANYHFNQGIASASNSTVTSVTDAAGVNTGTLVNMALSGSSSNWIAPGGVVSGSTTAASVNATLSVKGNGNTIPVGATTSTANNTDFGVATTKNFQLGNPGTSTLYINSVTLSGAGAGFFSVTPSPSSSLASNATSTFNIVFSPTVIGTSTAIVSISSNDCTYPTYTFVISANSGTGSSIAFDGSNDQVAVGTNTVLDVLNAPFTMEAWVYPTTTKYNTIISKGDGNGLANNGEYIFQVSNNGKLALHNTSVNGWKYSNGTIPNNQWTHVAAVFNGSSTVFYINGLADSYLASTTNTTNSSGYNFYIGRQGQNCNCNFFQGSIDEVRVWKEARTQCQIQTYMSCEIPTTATNLVANYHFNNGIPSGNNAGYTTLVDAAGANTGTLVNSSLSGATSNWVANTPVTNGFSTTAIQPATLSISGNGNNVPVGATTSTANNTNFKAALTKTFVLSNPGTGTLYITTGYFTGPNAAQFSVTTIPSTAIATGTTAMVITLTPTSTGVYNATLNIISNDCANPNFSFAVTSSISPATALLYDGVNDFVTRGVLTTTQTNVSLQSKVRWNSNGSNQMVAYNGSSGSNGFGHYIYSNGALALLFGGINFYPFNYTLSPGVWTSITTVVKPGIAELYVNGLMTNTIAISTMAVPSGSFNIGGNGIGFEYYAGYIDEVLFWNKPLSQCEIQSYLTSEITSTASGLLANYHFNQGIPSGSNTAITSLIDATGSYNGTLSGFALTGATSNWVSHTPAAVVSGNTVTTPPGSSLSITGNGNNVPVGATTSTTNFTDFGSATTRTFVISNSGTGTLNVNYVTFSGTAASLFSVVTTPSNAVTTGTTPLVISVTPTAIGVFSAVVNLESNDCAIPSYSFVISANSGTASSIAFDGTDDHINLGPGATFKPTSALTAEAWAYRTNWASISNTQAIVANTESAGYGIHLAGGIGEVIGFLRRNGVYATVTYSLANLTSGWHHFALTYDGQYTKLFIDGQLRSMDNAGATYTVNYLTANSTFIGCDASTGTVPAGSYFQGNIDEVRIWNYARTHCQIQQYMGCEITSTASGLVGNFHFNQGIPNGSNATYTIITNSAAANHGTLTNAALTGTNSNWTSNAGVASGYTVVGTQNASLSVSGNGNNVPVGTTTSTTNATNFNGALTQTFVLSNAGSGTVFISTGYFTGANASQFSVTTIPSTAIVSGTTALVITATPTTVGTFSAILNIISNDCANPNYSFAVTTSVTPPSSVCLTGAHSYIVGSNAAGVAIGSFDSDNINDALVAYEGSNYVGFFRGSVNGTVSFNSSYTVGTQPYHIEVADFNADGKNDFAVTNRGSNNVSVLLGSGTGTFGSLSNLTVGTAPKGMVATDINADGKVDIITANSGSGNVSVLLGNGSGGFGSASNYTTGSGPVSLLAKDFNADGKIDLAVANYTSNNVAILFGSGGGSFGSATTYTVGSGPTDIATADFNNDGKSDLVVTEENTNAISILYGLGSGLFSSANSFTSLAGPTVLKCADMNSDGQVDIVVASKLTSNLHVYYGTGLGVFNGFTYNIGNPYSLGLDIGDLNNDSKLDIAITSYTANGFLLVHNGPAILTTFTPSVGCVGYSATLAATGGTSGSSYLWNPGGLTSGTVSVNPGTTTVYTLNVNNGPGCTGTAIRTLVINPANAMSVYGNGNLIAAGSTTTSTLNATDWNGEVTKTYVISNTTNSVSITNAFDTGPNSAQFFITTLPATTLGVGSTSFVVTLTPTSTGVYNATINIQSSDCGNPTYSFVVTTSITPASALSFDGINDNVSVATNSLINFGTGDMTVEAYIKTSQSNSNFTGIVAKASTSAIYGFQLGIQNGKIAAEVGSSTTFLAATNGLAGVTNLANNTWHHLAMVVNRSQNSVKLYVDGILDAVVTHTAIVGMDISTTFNMFIGKERTSTYFFNGNIDEVRLWNVARSQCEIQTYMGAEITSTASGLVANYHFNQGVPGANNTAITTLTEAANSLTGNFSNISRTGTTSNFVYPGAVPNGYTTTAAPTASIALTGNGASIPQGASTNTANNTDFGGNTTRTFSITNVGSGTLNINNIVIAGAGASQFTVSTLPASAITTGTTGFQITYVPTVAGQVTAAVMVTSNDCANPNYSFVITASTTPAGALSFDGSNDNITFANNLSTWNIGNNFTIETWIKPNNVSNSQLLLYTGYGCIDCPSWALSIGPENTCAFSGGSIGRIVFMATNKTSTNAVVQSLASPSVGVWTHVAVTGDGSSLKMYVNGVLQSTAALTFTIPSSTYRNLGADPSVTGGCNIRYAYNGNMDELRFWNVARTQCEIQSYMSAEITTTATGLTANYHFNQGLPSGANSTQTVLVDAVAANGGTLNGMALTGTVSNWVNPGSVTNGFTTVAVPGATLSVSGNGNAVPIGATTSTTNNTDFSTNNSRVFTVSNTGTTTLYVNSISFAGANAAQFSVNALPASSVAVAGSSTFSILFTPTAVGISSAVVNISSNDCAVPNYSFVITASASPASALNFDGVNDYVTTNNTLTASYTKEAWIYINSSSSSNNIISGGTTTSGHALWVPSSNGYKLASGHNGTWNYVQDPTSLSFNTWYHVALTYDAPSNTMKLYKNGVLVSYNTSVPSFTGTNVTLLGSIANAFVLGGALDEVRIWNTVRTQCEIQQYMNCEITSTASGLVANYHFNQGVPSGTNTTVTSLIDATGAYTGTLTSFTLTGTTSNWISPGGVVNDYTVTTAPQATIAVSGNGNNVPVGAGTSTNNFTDFGTNTSRTFSISNTGTSSLNVGPIVFTGANAAQFSVNASPASSIAASGSSTFSILFTPTAAGISSAVVNISSNDCTVPNYSFVISASTTPASALAFDGSDDYVVTGTSPTLTGTPFTVEFWAKRSTNGVFHVAVSQGTANTANSMLHIGFRNSNLFTFPFYSNDLDYSGSQTTDGQWHHWACVYTYTNNATNGKNRFIYCDGALVASDLASSAYAGIGPLYIGKQASNINPFNGSMDELRVWNTARTQCEIQTYMRCEITSTATGLMANYHFNQGIPSGLNSSVTVLTDAAGTYSGALNSFSLAGSTSNWVSPGGVVSGSTTTAPPSATMAVSGNGSNIPVGVSTSTANFTDFNTNTTRTYSITNAGTGTLAIGSIYFTGTGASRFSTSVLPASAVTTGTTGFTVLFTPTAVGITTAVVNITSNDCAVPNYSFVISASTTPADALTFDGVNDYVAVASSTSIPSGNSPYTIEAWIKTTTSANMGIVAWGNYGTNNQCNAFRLGSGGTIVNYWWANDLIVTAPTLTNGAWHHVAATYDGVTRSIYADGVLLASDTPTGLSVSTTSNITIGTSNNLNEFFNGSIDEVRIWNVARTQCELQQFMKCEITSTASGLVFNSHFNQGIPSGTNTAVTTLSNSAASNNGTLTNFTLTGATSNWTSPGGVVTGSTTPATISSSLTVSGNGNTVPIGATTSTTNLTDFGLSTTNSFVISNAGTGTLNIGNIIFAGTSGALFSVTTLPANAITTGTTSFAITFTPTAVGNCSAVVKIASNDCAFPNYSFVITGSTSAASALSFNGNQVIQTGIDADTDVMPNTTWEAWVYPTTTAAGYRIIAAIDDGGWDRFITLNGNQIRVATANSSEATVTTYSANQWYHLAVVYQQSLNKAYVYVNGIQYGPYTTAYSGSGTSVNNFMIGANINYQNYFVGKIDEVRVWNTARAQCDIQTFMNCEIPTTATGLIGNFHFNQGVPSGSNTSVTTATNAAAATNGTLISFALTGTTTNWVSPGAIVNGYTTTNAPTASFSITGNGNAIAFGSTSSSTLNNTDFGTNASRTFSIYNAGSGTLNINSIYFTGTNASQFSVTTLPASSLTTGGSSFVITLTPTNTGISTATVNIPSNDCTNPTFSFVITASTSPASAFKFDGFNDYVTVAHNNTLNTLPFTVETWFKTGLSASGAYGLVSKYASGLFNGWNLYYASGTVSGYYFGDASNYVNWPITSTVTISDNNWHHAAMVVDVNGATIYIDGVRAGPTSTWVGTPTAASNTLNVQIANYSNNYHPVEIDEVRLWNTARTQCELQTNMSAEITTTASGLMANYHFNQGVPSGPNTSVTTVLDATGNNNGTLIAVALTGTTSNWISPGGIANGYTITSPPQVTLVVSGNGNNVPIGINTSTNNFTDFNTNNQRVFAATNSGTNTLYINSINFTGANAAQFSVNAMPTASIAASGSSTFSILFTPTAVGVSSAVVNVKSNDCANPNYSFVISASVTAAEALRFNGSNSVTVANSSTINFGTGDLTIEAHVKTSNSFANFTGLVCKSSNANVSGYQLAMLNNKVAAEIGDGTTAIGTAQGLLGTTGINDNQWHHVAMVVNRAQNSIRLFVDGNLDASYTNTVVSTLNITNTFNLFIGAERTSNFLFNGSIDDVRLWNTARTQCELQQYMNCEITSTASGLVANYHFNQGIPSGPNSAVTTLTDAVGANNGTLTGFVLTGSVSNWVNPGGVITGSTTPAAVNVTLSLTGNGNNVPTGTTTTTNNGTDMGVATAGSFVIQKSGANNLNIGPIYFTGPNAAQFSVTNIPSASLSSGSTTLGISITPTSTGVQMATVNVISNDCAYPNYSFVITTSIQPAAALDFSGTGAYVVTNNTLSGSYTKEAWIYSTNSGISNNIMSSGTNNVGSVFWAPSANGFKLASGHDGSWTQVQDPTALTTNTWYHVAVTFDASSNTMKLYKNGVQVAMNNSVAPSASVTSVLIGSYDNGNFFQGKMDEVRMWNYARTQCDIQTYMNCEITSTMTGLTSNYHFNQGVPGGSNATASLAINSTGSGSGTLTGFALSGSTSNWVNPGAVTSGSTTPATVNASLTVLGNGNNVPVGNTTTTLNGTSMGSLTAQTFSISNAGTSPLNVGAIYFSGPNAAQFSLTTVPSTLVASSGTTGFVISLTPTSTGVSSATVNISSNDCVIPTFSFVVTASVSPASAIALDGSNDNLRAPLFSTNTTSITMEAWVNWSGTNGNTQVIMHNGNTGGNGYGLFLPSNSSAVNVLIGGIYTGGLNYSLTPNVWTKLSLSIDNTKYILYANGIAVYANTLNGPATPSGSFCVGGNLSGAQTFNGKVDEVRFWDKVLTPCEVQTYLSAEITTTATGLTANYHFNQGIPSGVNTAVTTCTDAAGSNNLTVFNLALTGTLSNWVSPGAVANGFSTTTTVSAVAAVSGNGNAIAASNFTPQTSNFTDFGTASSRTFVVTNSGTTALNAVQVTLSGANASEFTVTSAAPTTVAPGGTMAVTVVFTPTATGTRNATVTVLSNDCTYPNYSFAIMGIAPTADALYFDGINDFASRTAPVTTATNNITMQAKVKLTGGTGYHQFIATNGSYALMMNVGGYFCAYVPPFGIVTSTYALSTNTWVALSMVLKNNTVNMYADGVFVGSSQLSAVTAPSGSFVIGANVSGGEMFKGVIDEVLVWTKALTQCEIQTYLNTEIATTASSLIANYHFNQGSPALNNAGVNSITDVSGNNYNATLNNFTLTGTVSNWVSPGGVTQGNTVTTAPSATLLVTGNGNTITTGATTTSTLNLTDFGGLCLNTTATSKTYSLYNSGTTSLQIASIRLSSTGTPFTLTATPAIYNASTGGTFAVAMSPTATGSYSNTVIVETNDCNNPLYSFVISSTVNALPTVSVVASSTQVCSNSTVALSGSGANTYTWSSGITNGTAFSPTATSVYTVAGTSTLTGCTNTAVQTVSILALPNIVAGGDPTICIGGSGSASVTGGVSYTWTGIGTGSAQVVSPTVTTIYTVTGMDANGCSNIAYHTMTVNVFPTITVASGTICENGIFTITPTGAGVGGTYTIPFGSYTVSGSSFLVSPPSSTFFIVIGSATTGCSSQGTMNGVAQITVSPIPTLAVNSTSICTGNAAIITPSGAATYTITGGTFTVSPLTTSAYTVTGTSSVGCTATLPAISQVTVFNTPTITVNSGSVCDGQSIAIVPSGANTYTITGNNFTVSPSSTTAYSVTGTSTNGCSSTVAIVSNVTVFPNPTITVPSGSLCEGQSFTITPSGASSYTYSSGTAIVSPTVTTSYTVSGSNAAGCVALTPAQVNLTVYAVPIITVNSASICSGNSIAIVPSGADTYTITGNNFTVTPLTTTSYSVSGTSTAGCVSTVQAVSQITVFASPTIAVNSGSICEGSTFAIVPSGATSYTITGGNFTVNPLTTTAYSVTGSFTTGCTSNTVVSQVTVDPTPTITALSGSICAGDVYTITPLGGTNYTYSSGSNTVNPLVNTTYSVTGTSTAGCVSQTAAIVTVTVNAVPVLTVNSGTICEGGTFVITPTGADTYTITGSNFTVTPLTTSSYSISGTSTAGCISTVQAISQVSVLINPTISVSSTTLCEGSSYTIVPTGADTYTISGGSFVVTPTITTSYSVAGSYSYGCDAINPGVATVTVYTLPVITATNGAICINDSYTITPAGASTYTFLPAGPVVNPTTTTNYTITGTSADGCLSASGTTMDVVVNPLPTITVANGTICVGNGFTLSPSGADTYTFIPSGPAVTPTITSQYSITGTSADGCLSAAAAIATVLVNNNPTLTTVASSTSICEGDSVKFTASGAVSYTWTGNAINGSYFTPTAGGDYTVIGQDANGCLDTTTVALSIRSLPVLTVTASNPASCANETITLMAVGADTFTYNGTLNSASMAISPSVTTNYTVIGTGSNGCSNTTIYTHTVIPCTGDIEFNAVITDVSCRLRNDGSITLVPRVTFTNSTIEYVWSGVKCPNKDCSTVKELAAGNYSVRINVSSTVTSTYIRKDTVERTFTILDIQPSCDLKIYNTVTLNENGLNDVWNIDNIDLYPTNKVTIFNRWGAKVYEVTGYNNNNKSWPTVADREFLPAGTYFYVIDLGDNKPIKGWLELIKE